MVPVERIELPTFGLQTRTLPLILHIKFGSCCVHVASMAQRFIFGHAGACPNSRCSSRSESDSTLGYEQVFSPLEYRSDAASATECAGLRAERPCRPVYR